MKRRTFIADSFKLGVFSMAAGMVRPRDLLGGTPSTSLKGNASACDLRVGCQAVKANLEDKRFADFVKANFNLLSPGNELKWGSLRPSADSFNFAPADWMVAFAQQNGMLVHGHNLCWNSPYNPKWLQTVLTPANARRYLTDHITTVMKHYAGQIDSWDVVNEPIVGWSKRPDGFYPGLWLTMLGTWYIDIAFRTAAEADPHALRCLNCYQLEHDNPESERTRHNVLTLLKTLSNRRVPIQAVGIESHLNASAPPGGPKYSQFLQQIQDLGLKLLVTELDVDDTKVEGDTQQRDEAIAKTYGDYLAQVSAGGNLNSVIFWTASDKFNWLNSTNLPPQFARSDGQQHRSGLVDEKMRLKPAYKAVAAAMQGVCH